MLNVLLVSTLPNAFHRALAERTDIALRVYDFAATDFPSKAAFLSDVTDLTDKENFGLLITYRCPYLIPADVRSHFGRCVNVHPLPLPDFAGANPWPRFLASGLTQAEAVAHELTDSPDGGPVIARVPYTVTSPATARQTADAATGRLIPNILPVPCVIYK